MCLYFKIYLTLKTFYILKNSSLERVIGEQSKSASEIRQERGSSRDGVNKV